MIHVVADLAAAAAAAAARLAEAAKRAIAERGRFRVALPGGETPVALYRLLASPAWRGRVDWLRVQVLFTDERAVAPDSPDSTYALVRDALARPLSIPETQLRRMRADAADLEAAARDYEAELDTPLDLALLGVGPDGHVASLFPGSPVIAERLRRVAVVRDSPKPPPVRLTLTPRPLREARTLAVLCAGAGKAEAVARAHAPDADPLDCPAAIAAGGDWYLDRAAAAAL